MIRGHAPAAALVTAVVGAASCRDIAMREMAVSAGLVDQPGRKLHEAVIVPPSRGQQALASELVELSRCSGWDVTLVGPEAFITQPPGWLRWSEWLRRQARDVAASLRPKHDPASALGGGDKRCWIVELPELTPATEAGNRMRAVSREAVIAAAAQLKRPEEGASSAGSALRSALELLEVAPSVMAGADGVWERSAQSLLRALHAAVWQYDRVLVVTTPDLLPEALTCGLTSAGPGRLVPGPEAVRQALSAFVRCEEAPVHESITEPDGAGHDDERAWAPVGAEHLGGQDTAGTLNDGWYPRLASSGAEQGAEPTDDGDGHECAEASVSAWPVEDSAAHEWQPEEADVLEGDVVATVRVLRRAASGAGDSSARRAAALREVLASETKAMECRLLSRLGPPNWDLELWQALAALTGSGELLPRPGLSGLADAVSKGGDHEPYPAAGVLDALQLAAADSPDTPTPGAPELATAAVGALRRLAEAGWIVLLPSRAQQDQQPATGHPIPSASAADVAPGPFVGSAFASVAAGDHDIEEALRGRLRVALVRSEVSLLEDDVERLSADADVAAAALVAARSAEPGPAPEDVAAHHAAMVEVDAHCSGVAAQLQEASRRGAAMQSGWDDAGLERLGLAGPGIIAERAARVEAALHEARLGGRAGPAACANLAGTPHSADAGAGVQATPWTPPADP